MSQGSNSDRTGRTTPRGRGPARSPITRRNFLAGSALGAAGVVIPTALADASARIIEKAATVGPHTGSISDIEHVVILMQENRSFDHYFGTLSGVRGFSDPSVLTHVVGGKTYPVFDQFGYEPGVGVTSTGYMQPFHLIDLPPLADGECTNDIDHGWSGQHQSWANGAMTGFMASHLANDGATNGPVTMGYFNQSSLPFYYDLANAFTICDHYFCSVLGPTDPNRLMMWSGSIDPAGVAGGPVVETFSDPLAEYGTLSWETMPERLLAAGVSWKVYNDPIGFFAFNDLPFFKNYNAFGNSTQQALAAGAITPSYPTTFASDIAANTLPAVSWIVPPPLQCEHPAFAPEWGEALVSEILGQLLSNPEVWATTMFIVTYDENGGFFDHVPPPTPPAGTAGEYLTASPLPSAANGLAGPVGLGFRVPTFVISPYSRGGYVSSEVFDHTSLLRLIETRFGVEAPNISAWRRSVTGDLTATLALANPPNVSAPSLPVTTTSSNSTIDAEVALNAVTGSADDGTPYPLPAVNIMPSQATSPVRPPVPT
jgi:phospholipase C